MLMFDLERKVRYRPKAVVRRIFEGEGGIDVGYSRDVETAHGMLAWPHSGFHVQDAVWIAADGREFSVTAGPFLLQSAESEGDG